MLHFISRLANNQNTSTNNNRDEISNYWNFATASTDISPLDWWKAHETEYPLLSKLAQDFLRDYVFLAVGRVGSTTDFITQKVEYAGGGDREKMGRLLEILSKCEGLTLNGENKYSGDVCNIKLSSPLVSLLSANI